MPAPQIRSHDFWRYINLFVYAYRGVGTILSLRGEHFMSVWAYALAELLFIVACHSCDSDKCSIVTRFSEILAGDVCFVNLFRSILPVVPTECDVFIVCRQHDDKEWKFKEQHAKMWENIVGAKRYSRPRGFNIAGASDPAVPTP